MAGKRQPTNADLYEELRNMGAQIGTIDNRLNALERWKIAYDAAKEAVAEYKMQESKSTKGSSINKDLVKAILAALAVIATLVGIAWGAN